MSRNERLSQGLRARKILESLNINSSTVTRLRHSNAKDYEEIFGSNHPLANAENNESRLLESNSEVTDREDNHVTFPPENPGNQLQFTESIESSICNRPAGTSKSPLLETFNVKLQTAVSSDTHCTNINDADDSLPADISAHLRESRNLIPHVVEANQLDSIDDIEPYLMSNPPSPSVLECNDLGSFSQLNSYVEPTNAKLHPQSLTARSSYLADDDTISLQSNLSQNRQCSNRLTKSWSLSNLTDDTVYPFSSLKKTLSFPLLTQNNYEAVYSHLDNPSLWLTFRNDLASLSGNGSDTETDIDTETDVEDINEGRKRRHKALPSTWKRNKAKLRRMQGEQYLGYSKPANRKFLQDTLRSARIMGERCKSDYCVKSKLRECSKISEDTRKQIHTLFWKQMNWDQRKIYVNALVQRSKTAQKTTKNVHSRRTETLLYFLPIKSDKSIKSEKVQVCRTMFLNTLSLGTFTVHSWTKNNEFGMTPHQELRNSVRNPTSRPDNTQKLLTLNNFLDNIPKLPSHYARKDTTKLFLEPSFQSLADIYRIYKKYCSENEETPVCRYTFEQQFRAKNLSLYTLKKDMCDVCTSYTAGNLNEADYQMHIIKKDRARQEKEIDKNKAAEGEFILLSMDLESVKVCPFLTASALYFKTKLTVHNFTVFNLISTHCTCYWFDETSADLTASTFVSFLVDYIERHCVQQLLPIVIYSDGCTYQNRNTIMSNALLFLSKKYNINITQKFLEPGHTQMECDSVHAAIERKLKNREIHLPSDYITITKEARRINPYEVIQIDYKFVKNYANPEHLYYKSIRPGRRAGDPQVVDIRAIKYNTMTIEVKLNFDEDWTSLPQRPKIISSEIVHRQMYSKRIPIKTTKFNHLQQLKAVLPNDCHAFYDSLPFE